jgi:predicted small integral membrane protein
VAGVFGFVCFWFPGCTDHARCVCGVCGLGLLFENYIVDASIFYKEAISKNMNLDLSGRLLLWPFWVVVVVSGWFLWFSRKLAFLIFCGQVFKSTRWMPWH